MKKLLHLPHKHNIHKQLNGACIKIFITLHLPEFCKYPEKTGSALCKIVADMQDLLILYGSFVYYFPFLPGEGTSHMH